MQNHNTNARPDYRRTIRISITLSILLTVFGIFGIRPVLAFDCNSATGISFDECEALVAIYYNIDGDNWIHNNGWLQTDTPPCNWEGVTCDNSGHVVKELDLSWGLNGNLPSEIGNLTNLTGLYLRYNELSSLPPEIVNLTNLTILDLKKNQLSSLPPEISNLTNLTDLDLARNNLSRLPSEIGNLINLTSLDLKGNKLSSLPPEFGDLTNLTKLDLNINQLSSLPPEIVNLTNLTDLDLSGNQLSSLLPEIVNLTNLTRLDLWGNQLNNLSSEIGNLTNLTYLGLAHTKLSSLPPEIVNLTNLTELNLIGNQLSILPSVIVNLTNLTGLHLQNNQLSSLPSEIGNLTNLTSLSLRINQLSSLPTEIVKLTNLTKLDLSNNQLSNLPPEIVNLTNLIELDLSGNQLLNGPLPAYLTTFGQLKYFSFAYTGLCKPRDQIFQDWLMKTEEGEWNNIDCIYMVLTHEPDSAIGDIQTFLDDNDVLFTHLYDNTRGDIDLKRELGISRSYLLEASPTSNPDLLQELRDLSEVEDCTYNEELQLDSDSYVFPDDPADSHILTDLFDPIDGTDGWKVNRSSASVLAAVVDDFRSLSPDAGIPPGHGELVAGIADSGEADMLLLNVVPKYEELAPFDAVFQAIEYAVDEKIEHGYAGAVINLSLGMRI
ncbi:leucine-rich repeat domain-containing protein [Desulfococcaceae bacterium HSG7]|nr:leucine-rich repeat domain-containing protein [Desulfococcaceae bacterium HSG7]